MLSISVFSSYGASSRPDFLCDSWVASGRTSNVLTQRCQFLLSQGLAPLTRRVYLSVQRRYIDFCRRDGHLNSDGSFPPADEETLMRFASLLADNLTHASIKVYLSAERSLHIDHGLSDPFVNCLRLQRLLRGIKRVQGPVSPVACLSPWIICGRFNLDWTSPGETMWCCGRHTLWVSLVSYELGSSRWILHLPSIHMTVDDLQADSLVNLKFIPSARRLIRFAWAVIYMWGVVRTRCVPSVPWCVPSVP